jgi:hypothetical protein
VILIVRQTRQIRVGGPAKPENRFNTHIEKAVSSTDKSHPHER